MWNVLARAGDRLKGKGVPLLAALAITLSPHAAQAFTHDKKPLARGLYLQGQGRVNPPIGFLEFCDRYPAECRPLGQPSQWRIRLTSQRWALLRQVNLHVNRIVKPMTDEQIYGRPEVWEYPANGMGDCEDYVLEKKRYLEALGFPAEALMIAVVLDEKGGGHAVLLVRTDRGDLALDNRRNRILPWNRTGYTYLMRQSQANPARWVALSRNPERRARVFGNN